jgi:hypothetical protein
VILGSEAVDLSFSAEGEMLRFVDDELGSSGSVIFLPLEVVVKPRQVTLNTQLTQSGKVCKRILSCQRSDCVGRRAALVRE